MNGGYHQQAASVGKREVEIFWRQVYRQAEGFFFRQGGPVVGIQIENEYGHCGGLQGEAERESVK